MRLQDYVRDWLDYCRKKGLDEKTIYEHSVMLKKVVLPAVGVREVSSLRLTDAAEVIEKAKPFGEYGPQRAIVTLRRFLKYLKDSDVFIRFDWRDLELPKVPQKRVEYFTAEELELMRNCFADGTLADIRTRTLIEVLLDTGMRISEACSLDRDDVNWEKREAWVTNAKTKEKAAVYFTERSLAWLDLYLSKRRDDVPALFVSGRGRLLPVTSRNFIRKKTKHLHFGKRICHHILRRTLATELVKNNVDFKSLQTIMRHASVRTTLRVYAGFVPEKVREEHERVMGDLTQDGRGVLCEYDSQRPTKNQSRARHSYP